MRLTRVEKQLLIAACVVACLLGGFAAYLTCALEEEHQFHGGVLEEDAAQAMWHLISVAAVAFAQIGVSAFLIIGVIPLSLWRFVFERSS